MVAFVSEEKEGALNENKPMNGYAHRQFGLGVRSGPHEGGTQLFHGVEYGVVLFAGREQNLSVVAPDSVQIGLSTSLQL